jgi:hypothetical protein
MERWYGRRAENRKLKMEIGEWPFEVQGKRVASRKRDSSQKTRWNTLPHFADFVRNDGLSFSREFETRRGGRTKPSRGESPFVAVLKSELKLPSLAMEISVWWRR